VHKTANKLLTSGTANAPITDDIFVYITNDFAFDVVYEYSHDGVTWTNFTNPLEIYRKAYYEAQIIHFRVLSAASGRASNVRVYTAHLAAKM